ncbi:hypothetical protein LCI18_005937 [Fusarium solani-melongenae]|uniref:Uncharacterized protein n=1 Tax=Fusarium solani subsp. cucurbitae TaxID=2747967 RepID=A0ACD3Z1L5_FUSSC|nr:hypothetical protein LCI18_005937 [Fusarium solani-melongenae]
MVARDLTFDEKHTLDLDSFRKVKVKWERKRQRRVSFIALVPHDVLASFLQCDGETSPDTLEPLMAFFARSSMRPGASKCVFDTLLHLSRQLEFTEAISGKTLALCLKAFVQFGETSLAISSCECPTNQFKFITRLVPPPSRDFVGEVESPKLMLGRAREMICSCLDSMGSGNLGQEAGSLVADLSLYFSDPAAFQMETALPKFRGMSNPLPFHLSFLDQLRNLMVKEELPERAYSHLFKETSPVNQDQLEYQVKDVRITDFLVCLIKSSTKSDDLVSLFAYKIVVDAPRFRATELATLWMPLLCEVPGKLIENKIPLNTPCYQQLCSALVISVLDNLVGPEPVDTESQARGSVSCGCVYCTQLNEFLADSSQSVGTLPIARTEREHLKDEIKSADIDCKCEAVPGDSPCTLMTKAPSPQHVKNREAWVSRRETTYNLLRKMGKSHLEQLLGPDYSLFLGLERTVHPPATPQPGTGMKRKVSDTDIVDLRGEKKNFKITSFFTKK